MLIQTMWVEYDGARTAGSLRFNLIAKMENASHGPFFAYMSNEGGIQVFNQPFPAELKQRAPAGK